VGLGPVIGGCGRSASQRRVVSDARRDHSRQSWSSRCDIRCLEISDASRRLPDDVNGGRSTLLRHVCRLGRRRVDVPVSRNAAFKEFPFDLGIALAASGNRRWIPFDHHRLAFLRKLNRNRECASRHRSGRKKCHLQHERDLPGSHAGCPSPSMLDCSNRIHLLTRTRKNTFRRTEPLPRRPAVQWPSKTPDGPHSW
jgi:hypothetical protein